MRLRFLTAGESHGPCLIGTVEGLPAGMETGVEFMNEELARRQAGYGRGDRMKIERDRVEILAGVLEGRTTGAPIALRIENHDWDNWKDRWANGSLPRVTVARPGHADFAGAVKYGFAKTDPVLERASARETAMRVAVGSLAKQLLQVFGVQIGSYVLEIGGVTGGVSSDTTRELWQRAEMSEVRCPDEETTQRMRETIDAARAAGDSVGGIFVVGATGVPVGLGSHVHWDRRLDARLAYAVMSIPGVKGVEIGTAFDNARERGTNVHDEMYPNVLGGVRRETNRAGGIEGGITNGSPVVVRAAMKPIPTTVTPLRSVDLASGKASETQYQRSDVCAVPAAAVVGEAMVSLVLADALLDKLGGDTIVEMQRAFEQVTLVKTE
jgi:chorismate synthase